MFITRFKTNNVGARAVDDGSMDEKAAVPERLSETEERREMWKNFSTIDYSFQSLHYICPQIKVSTLHESL